MRGITARLQVRAFLLPEPNQQYNVLDLGWVTVWKQNFFDADFPWLVGLQ